MFQETYEWYLSMLDDDDQEIIRFLRKTGEEHMARKPTVSAATTSRTRNERFEYMMRFADPSQMMSGGTRSKWERIGKPLFTPSIEMAMYFTPMNPVVYRILRGIITGYDVSEGVYDRD